MCTVVVVASEVRERSENVITSDKSERIVRRKRTSRLKREDDIITGAEGGRKRRRGEAEEGGWEESPPKTPSRQTSLEGFKRRLFFPPESAARWTMAECVQDSCEFSLFDNKQNERPV